MRIEADLKLDFSDVLFRPKRSTLKSRKEVDLTREYHFKYSPHPYRGIPIMAANMDGVGTLKMAESLSEKGLFTCLVKRYTPSDISAFKGKMDAAHVAISTGTSDKDLENLQAILKAHPSYHTICIDVANGYSEHFGDFVSRVRKLYPDHIIIAGNVVTADMTQELILRGADIVKVGIGPGRVCTTRIQTGVGYPQLSAIIECADAAHGLGAHIIADGGCTCPGDVAKAFGAGADFVMLGGMLAGHDEGEGSIVTKHEFTGDIDPTTQTMMFEPYQYVEFYGMSSDTAMKKHNGEIADYRSSEGRTVKIPYRGPVAPTIQDLLGGIRSTCTYVGAENLKHLSKCTTFIRVARQFNDVFA